MVNKDVFFNCIVHVANTTKSAKIIIIPSTTFSFNALIPNHINIPNTTKYTIITYATFFLFSINNKILNNISITIIIIAKI